MFGFSKSPEKSLLNAIETLQKSIDIDESVGHAYGLLGHIYSLMRQYEKAILEGEKAVELSPSVQKKNGLPCLQFFVSPAESCLYVAQLLKTFIFLS